MGKINDQGCEHKYFSNTQVVILFPNERYLEYENYNLIIYGLH